jgi:hypothetical protein
VFGLPRLTRIVTAHYGGAAPGRKISHPVAEDQARYGHRPWIEQRIGPHRVPTPRTPGFEFTWAVSRRLRTHGASKTVTLQPAPATSLQRRWCRTVGGPEPIPRCRCAQVSDATDVLPDFNPCCPLQQSASRVHRRGVRSALHPSGVGRAFAPGQAGSLMCVACISRSDSGSFITECCAFFRKSSYSRAIAGETTSSISRFSSQNSMT